MNNGLQLGLESAAVMQVIIALLNLRLEQLMGWQVEMERMPLLIREVHRVHAWFISATLLIFALLTWRFAGELSTGANALGIWLCAGIAGFWGLRTILQITYYSASHWRGNPGRTCIHVAALLIYAGFTTVYLAAAMLGGY